MAENNTHSPLLIPDAEQLVFAEIIIPLALPKNYTWSIPDRLLEQAKVGVRVEVELRKKRYAGVIKKMHNNKRC